MTEGEGGDGQGVRNAHRAVSKRPHSSKCLCVSTATVGEDQSE